MMPRPRGQELAEEVVPTLWFRGVTRLMRGAEHTAPDEAEIASDLTRRVAAGDRRAEGELVSRYSRGLKVLLQRITGSADLAEDLHQETFRIVLERLRRRGLEEPAGLAAFLRGTARNLALAERRKEIRRKTEGDEDALAAAPHPAPSQLSAVLLDEEAAAVRRLLDELEVHRDRELLLRFYVADEAKDSICADLGLDRLHFNRVVFRARQRFKELFERRHASPYR